MLSRNHDVGEKFFSTLKFKENVTRMANRFTATYVMPINHKLLGKEADPAELNGRLKAEVLESHDWYHFHRKQLLKG